MARKTNGELFEMYKNNMPERKPIDYRPLSWKFTPKTPGIVVWLDNGDIVLYFPKEYEKENFDGSKEQVE